MDRKYEPLPILTEEQIKCILESDNLDKLIILPLSIGEYHSDWKYAQDICVRLAVYPEPSVRANAILGLAYIARTKRQLEKDVVKPIVLKALRDEKEFQWRIIDAIDDINIFLNWNIEVNVSSE
ncbi:MULTISPECIES: hypothetical protein [unclassified Dehalobacter]|uniref:hypothetical protein n=1 Tax=unclassified Dehalobacter TaxID=2635733 RepID=UPI000E6CE8E5|nr:MULTISPECIES: hypothetical protein [unclassified Dehalobacter]RJE48901.1 hypothetical protein A7K50_09160 [Dehalobacter sp. MCB1]TCX52065.1 hypothetical protein C1I36_07045 [Dehalobacter sp. 14DCB1]TCX53138.1 hypothetical protein C1I38_08810 [Dehalobacter sp. 12DCB1]